MASIEAATTPNLASATARSVRPLPTYVAFELHPGGVAEEGSLPSS